MKKKIVPHKPAKIINLAAARADMQKAEAEKQRKLGHEAIDRALTGKSWQGDPPRLRQAIDAEHKSFIARFGANATRLLRIIKRRGKRN